LGRSRAQARASAAHCTTSHSSPPAATSAHASIAAASSRDLLLNPIVLAELAWTLKRSYKKSRSVIADHLDLLLQSPEFVVPFGVEVADAVRRYREGSADFADYLLAAINRASGCRSTLTFDHEAADDDQFTLLKV